MSRRRPPIIVDFEASGSDADHCPDEVVRGVSRGVLLAHGRLVFEAAGRLDERPGARTACSDGRVVDRAWVDWLLAAASMRSECPTTPSEMILLEHWMAIGAQTAPVRLTGEDEPRHRTSCDARVVVTPISTNSSST